MKLRRLMLAALLMTVSVLGSISGASAQTIDREYRYDLVLLFPHGTRSPHIGTEVEVRSSDHVVIRDKAAYYFSSAATKAVFEKNPDRYLPGGHGWCLSGLYRRAANLPYVGEMPHPGDPRARTYAIGIWFFHRDEEARAEFEQDFGTIDGRTTLAVVWLVLHKLDHIKP